MAETSDRAKTWRKNVVDKIVLSPFPEVVVPITSFAEYIHKYLNQFGDKICMINADTGKEFSFKQTADLSNRAASAFIRMGLQKGDMLGLYAINSPEYAIAWLGAAAIGAIVTLINPAFTVDELETQLKDTDCVFLICDNTNSSIASEAAKDVKSIRKMISFDEVEGDFIPFSKLLADDGSQFKGFVSIDPKEQVLILPSSSGTTGLPKEVIHTHYTMISSLCQIGVQQLNLFTKDDVGLLVLPLYHIYGTLVFWISVTVGATAIIMSRFKPDVFLSSISKYKISSLPIVPPIVHFMIQCLPNEKFDMSSVKYIICGAAPLSKELESQISKKLKLALPVRQGYGMTELIPMTFGPLDFPRPDSVGVPLPDTKIKVVDIETNELKGPNEIGEIWGWTRGRTMKGYWNNPEATAETIDKEGWLHSGDLGYYDKDGYIFVVDRLKELIKFKGHQVAPAELEALLLTHPSLKDAAVIGVPDEVVGEFPRAYVVRKPGCQVTEQEVCDFVAGKTTKAKHLTGGVVFLDQIPKSAAGKILRKELRKKL